MEIEFDPAKNEANIALRGLSFEMVAKFNFDSAIVRADMLHSDDEDRFQAIGLIGNGLYFLVFTMRGTAVRVISLRKANRKERRLYDAQT